MNGKKFLNEKPIVFSVTHLTRRIDNGPCENPKTYSNPMRCLKKGNGYLYRVMSKIVKPPVRLNIDKIEINCDFSLGTNIIKKPASKKLPEAKKLKKSNTLILRKRFDN